MTCNCGPERVQFTVDVATPGGMVTVTATRPKASGCGNLSVCAEEGPLPDTIATPMGVVNTSRYYDPVALAWNLNQSIAAGNLPAALRGSAFTNGAAIADALEGGKSLIPYNWVDTDGVKRVFLVGLYDEPKELQALSACEKTHGVGTRATVNCLESLIQGAGYKLVPTAAINYPNFTPAQLAAKGGNVSLFSGNQQDAVLGSSGSVLDSIIGSIPTLLGALGPLANAGVIRGSLGNALTAYAAPQQAVVPAANGGTMAAGTIDAGVAQQILNAIKNNGALVGGAALGATGLATNYLMGGGSGGVADGSALFRARQAGYYLPNRILITGPDGKIHVLINAGLATRGSREKSVMKHLAHDNGFRCVRSGGRRGGR